MALSILTGRLDEDEMTEHEPVTLPTPIALAANNRMRRQYAARTVYLSESHLHDIDRIIEAWREVEPRRLNRSAVLRRAVEHLRTAVEADPVKSLMENL